MPASPSRPSTVAASLVRVVLAGLLGIAPLLGADPVAQFKEAMAGQDKTAKKTAISALLGGGDDDVVLPLLIQAVGDRQVSEVAIAALRARTGMQPSAKRGAGGYPGYPSEDTSGAWNAWLTARTADREKEKAIKAALKTAEDAKKQAESGKDGKGDGKGDGKDPTDPLAKGDEVAVTPEGAPETAPEVAPEAAPSDLGRIDRVVFKTGGSLRCYLLSKRTDPDGNLLSVRVVHPDNGGEETLAAELIARIEEDIQ